MPDKIETVGVVGLGVMGFDIAFLYAMKGYRTVAYDAATAVAESFIDRVEGTIERLKRRNRISEDEVENVRNGLTVSETLDGLTGLNLVTEAVSEVANTKRSVYRALRDRGCKGILTTNTSSIPREALLEGGSYDRKRFASTHFFNPVLYTQMVELVQGDMNEPFFKTTISFLKSLGRHPVETRDISGFVSNSILMYYAVMALHLLQSGARIEEIDQAAKQMGVLPPFISFDSWKPSIVEDVTKVMFQSRGDRFLRSSKLLTVLAQDNPRFYVEQKPNQEIYNFVGERQHFSAEDTIKKALKATIHVAAARVVELGEDPRQVDFISVDGLKIPQPPLKEIDTIGATALVEQVEQIKTEIPESELAAPEILKAMANERQRFYNDGQPNLWITSFLQRPASHACD